MLEVPSHRRWADSTPAQTYWAHGASTRLPKRQLPWHGEPPTPREGWDASLMPPVPAAVSRGAECICISAKQEPCTDWVCPRCSIQAWPWHVLCAIQGHKHPQCLPKPLGVNSVWTGCSCLAGSSPFSSARQCIRYWSDAMLHLYQEMQW